MKKLSLTLVSLLALTASHVATAADYVLDIKGAHAFINFKTKHLGYSFLTGRFNTFDGKFSYDAKNIGATKITVDIDATSIDSNHAERDKHLRGKDFLAVGEFPTAKFVSTKVIDKGEGKIEVMGDFTLHGITKNITIDATTIGEGKDPWGGYRAGFAGTTTINAKDYGFKAAWVGDIQLELLIEGIQQ